MISVKWLPAVLLLAGCAASSEPQDTAPAAMNEPVVNEPGVFRNLAYGEGNFRTLDFFSPMAAKAEPLVVFVHGGAWQGGSRGEYEKMCFQLQESGIAAATIDYRLSPAVTHPAHAEDAAAALDWLHGHAGKFHFNAAKIFVVGHSAGGHIAGTIATDSKLFAKSHVVGFVGLEGIYDIPNLAKRWPTYPNWFLNRAFGTDQTKWAAASPTRLNVVGKAPWLLVHSKGDELVDMGQMDDFAAHLEKAGVSVKTLRPEKKSHDGVVAGLSQPGDEVAAAIVEFVKGH